MLFITLIIVLINLIYNVSGIYYVISFIIWTINFITATLFLIQNPNNLWLRIVHAFSLIYLSYILYINLTELFLRIGWA
jgi:hypothetical protein